MDYIVPRGISYDAWAEWSPLARGYALAWERNRRETCPQCGTRHDEWKADRDAYVPDTHYCHGCASLAEQQKALPADEGRPRPGFHAYLRRPRPEDFDDDER